MGPTCPKAQRGLVSLASPQHKQWPALRSARLTHAHNIQPHPSRASHGHPSQTAPATFLPSPCTTPGPSHHYLLTNNAATATTLTFHQKCPPLYLATPMQHRHHHRVPRSRSTYAVTRSRTSAASPTPSIPVPVPLQRSGSRGTVFVGPVPRSARRWARSAHLHEVRRARQHHPHHHQHQ
jgi:hypothetical protein